jgi:hypothetical protein
MKALVTKSRSSNEAERMQALKEILTRAHGDVPYVPVFFQDATMALNTKYVYDGKFSSWTNFNGQWAPYIKAAEKLSN